MNKRLIDCVRGYEVLYNMNCKEYSDYGLKTMIWSEIAIKCGISCGDEAKEMWRKLRDCHREALRRKNMKKNLSSVEYIKPWKFQEEMSYLLPYMKDKRRGDTEQPMCMQAPEVLLTEETCSEELEELPRTPELENGDFREPLPKKRKLNGTVDYLAFPQSVQERLRWGDAARVPTSYLQDGLKHFFDSMFYDTKQLPLYLQIQVKRAVFKAVSEAQDTAGFNIPDGNSVSPGLEPNQHTPDSKADSPVTYKGCYPHDENCDPFKVNIKTEEQLE